MWAKRALAPLRHSSLGSCAGPLGLAWFGIFPVGAFVMRLIASLLVLVEMRRSGAAGWACPP